MSETAAPRYRYISRSDVGLTRSNNQDSGYAGPNLLVVADGMGGHAGGDVASSIAIGEISHLDHESHGADALEALRLAIMHANEQVSARVAVEPKLAGMGTTLTALLRHGDRFALAHIGDSRGYLLRDGKLIQVTHDHTFVQLLVDEGRISAEEAERHPQRSVVMRVLGDVGTQPEMDLSVRAAVPGDRWLLCSDGLSGFTTDAKIESTLRDVADLDACADKLIRLAFDGGGADNITVVIADVVAGDEPITDDDRTDPDIVGSAALNPHTPSTHTPDTAQIKTSESMGAAPGEPYGLTANGHSASGPSDEGGELPDFSDEEDERAHRRGRVRRALVGLLVIIVLIGAGWAGYAYTQKQYYVGSYQGQIAIYKGISQNLGPIQLGHLYKKQNIGLAELPDFAQQRVSETIPAGNLRAARKIVSNLRGEINPNPVKIPQPKNPKTRPGVTEPTTEPSSTPSAGPSTSAKPTGTGGDTP
ncbi:PP2C family protein-serine/threonine phosphatase [Spelaeicoccus albus]|uniref:Protein phosphatase n=1 Tax=Spelaeicoccus albus TaxID=1280376 RepID=A0A7Z0CZR9_9MICO|nr:PP2C family serine/threonine-protein phosphatase [Spelaeicoccus albus]NYI66611.1 protein phosphatase [Spelaeicoccus albus]